MLMQLNSLRMRAERDGQHISGAERLEADQSRGVRASRMDLSADCRQELCRLLEQVNLNNPGRIMSGCATVN